MNGESTKPKSPGGSVQQNLAQTSDDFTPIFVGGAPRSGTTLLHALICSSNKANGYIAECSYFGGFMHPFLRGLETFNIHTKFYFSSREEFFGYHASILTRMLSDFWLRTGRPEILALKDPLLTPHFHNLAKLLNQARFVVITRNPYDTISSRLEVMRRLNRGKEPKRREIHDICREYVDWYSSILDNRDFFGNRLCLVNYEKLVRGDEISKLEEFGITGITPDQVWSNAITNISDNYGNDWFSPHYGQLLTNISVGRHRQILSLRTKTMIKEICRDVSRQLSIPEEEQYLSERSIFKEGWSRLWRLQVRR
jgi:Sulfotransferase family